MVRGGIFTLILTFYLLQEHTFKSWVLGILLNFAFSVSHSPHSGPSCASKRFGGINETEKSGQSFKATEEIKGNNNTHTHTHIHWGKIDKKHIPYKSWW